MHVDQEACIRASPSRHGDCRVCDSRVNGEVTKFVTALGLSKATREFLTLHYFATDSAAEWNNLLRELLPKFPLPDAAVRRACAVKLSMRATLPLRIDVTPMWLGLMQSHLSALFCLDVERGDILVVWSTPCLRKLWRFVVSLLAAMRASASCRSSGCFQMCSRKASWPLRAHLRCWLPHPWVIMSCTLSIMKGIRCAIGSLAPSFSRSVARSIPMSRMRTRRTQSTLDLLTIATLIGLASLFPMEALTSGNFSVLFCWFVCWVFGCCFVVCCFVWFCWCLFLAVSLTHQDASLFAQKL